MNHKVKKVILPVAFVFVMVGLIWAAPTSAKNASDKIAPAILVNVDTEMGGYIRRAVELASQKDYAGAIEILQHLLDRRKQCFVPTEDPRRFISLSVKVHEVIGQLPPEGIKLYRRLYDPKAERMFRAAAERLDESSLRDIINRYLHTSYGDDALNLLGGILFDRGEFSQAAYYWGRIVSTFDLKDEPVLLAKIAISHHFTGDADRSAEAMKLLTGKHPQARAVIGGKEQNVADFARRLLSMPPPVAGPRRVKGWPSLAGAPDALAVMSPCRAVPSTRWSARVGELKDNPGIKAGLSTLYRTLRCGRTAKSESVSLSEGRVLLSGEVVALSGSKTIEAVMPAIVHPIVVGDTVLYRSADGIVAHNLLTGEKLWQSRAFDLYRRAPAKSGRHYMPLPVMIEDQGQWTLTAGGGKVFAVGKSLPDSVFYFYVAARRSVPPPKLDNSVLAAFSITEQGRLLWQVGQGRGDSNLLRSGRFVTAPTFADGRLYVLVRYLLAIHLVCLNAENGRLVWEVMVGQTPVRTLPHVRYRGYWLNPTSPPAVAGGKIFVVTNAGVIAAFEAETGRHLWAYQYDSSTARSYPFNPVIVTADRVFCLPADCEQLLAIRADTGKLDWSADRRKLHNLTALGDSRLLLSGKGLGIIDAATGKDVWVGKKITDIHGRPAVTTNAILASGKGEIIRVSLKDFSVTRLPVKQPDAILGNLICVNGKLIAANAAGVSAYFPGAPNADR